jgi:hypothetical protein
LALPTEVNGTLIGCRFPAAEGMRQAKSGLYPPLSRLLSEIS